MKKSNYKIVVVLFYIFVHVSCSKDIQDRTADIPALAPTNNDTLAGSWKLIALSRPDSFSVAVPAAINSTSYIAELNEIKGLQLNMTAADAAKIKYWSAGGVLRWNEIMRGLVAKYNLPPYQDDAGNYPIPSSANPFAYPLFPFANPPYAARAYAYVSAAQYDALVACWNYKKRYARLAPYRNDSQVKNLVPASSLPSYPSEAAVLAGVTSEMMKLLFPTEIAFVQQKADEQILATLRSGAASRSDADAGEALGRQIAQVFLARARTDNAGKAVGDATLWQSLESNTRAKGETPWISLETPKRPPMLPLYGKVKTFLFDSAQMQGIVPPAPPATGSAQMKKELEEVAAFVKNPSLENQKLVLFWSDGAGTYTPPGHWNAIAAEDFIKMNLSEVRWARNMALLNMSLMDAGVLCWHTKYLYFNPRPSQLDPSIQSLTGIPNFPAYISGHSTFSGAASTILGYLVPSRKADYLKMADDASKSRLVGALHYRSDCEQGIVAGRKVGDFAIARAIGDGAQ